MRRYVHATIRLAAALIVVLVLAAPAAAQEGDAIPVTFELTLNGDVPAGEAFLANISYVQGGGTELPQLRFCGFEGKPACEGNGTVYRQTLALDKTYVYRYSRVAGGEGHIFFEGTDEPKEGQVIRAYFDYGSADKEGADTEQGDNQQSEDTDQQMPEEMPATGVGGTAGSSVPLAVPLATMPFLIAAACAALRRR